MDDRLKALIKDFSLKQDPIVKPKVVELKTNANKISKPVSSPAKHQTGTGPGYLDLPPSLADNLTVVFIGFNPGIQSSVTQHHYAHFSNLFWKLFNQSRLIFSVLRDDPRDAYLREKTKDDVSSFAAHDDNELLKYGIGFTDLVLRCTKAVSELTSSEKLENVPRLIEELKTSSPRFIVIVGKGIWETIVRYLNNGKIFKFKNFKWGEQVIDQDRLQSEYSLLLLKLSKALNYNYSIYVFPNTSGLVTSLKYSEKLQLWNSLVSNICQM